MAKLYNLARMTTATTGTGTITLGVAVSGCLTFAQAGVANGDVVDYAIKDGSNSEHGTGTYTASGTTLTRTVTRSTNGNAAISLSGTAEVFISPRAETLNDASLFTTGSLADARLSGNVPLKNGANAFTNTNTWSGASTFGNNVTITAGTFACQVGSSFTGPAGVAGVHQFQTNSGTSATITNPPAAGMPFWFLASDVAPAGAAGYSLHRAGAYAINFGLDTDNWVRLGGWSDGAGVVRWSVGPGGDGFYPRSLGVAVSPTGVAGDVRALSTAKAWVRFASDTGSIVVKSSFQVSSVTRSSAGVFVVNFTTAFADANYLAVCTCNSSDTSLRYGTAMRTNTISTTSFGFDSLSLTNGSSVTLANADNTYLGLVFFR